MSKVFRLAQPRQDALRGKIDQMVIDSRYPIPKIDTLADPPHAGVIFLDWQDTTTVPDGTLKILHSFPHKYNKMPTAFGNYTFDNGTVRVNGVLPFQLGAQGIVFVDTDDTNVNLKYYSLDIFSSAINPFLMQIKFYVMSEHGFES